MTENEEAPARPPIPKTEISQGFWDAIAEGRLSIQRCTSCGLLRHYPQLRCPSCHSPDSDWADVSGRGRVHSYTVAHRAFHPAWKDTSPT